MKSLSSNHSSSFFFDITLKLVKFERAEPSLVVNYFCERGGNEPTAKLSVVSERKFIRNRRVKDAFIVASRSEKNIKRGIEAVVKI